MNEWTNEWTNKQVGWPNTSNIPNFFTKTSKEKRNLLSNWKIFVQKNILFCAVVFTKSEPERPLKNTSSGNSQSWIPKHMRH